jgi:hypothetical protein
MLFSEWTGFGKQLARFTRENKGLGRGARALKHYFRCEFENVAKSYHGLVSYGKTLKQR